MKLLPTLLLLTSALPCPAALVAYWNFNDLSIASADSPGSGGAPTTISATQGSGTLDLSSWDGTVDDFAGTTLEAINSDPAGNSLSLIAGSGTAGNGSSISLQVSLAGLGNPVLRFATQGTATGFNSNQLAWSLDGTNFTPVGSPYDPPTSFGLQSVDLSSVDALDGAASAWLRLSFDGASGSTGNNRLDNLQLHATPTPEPSSLMLLVGGALLGLRRRR